MPGYEDTAMVNDELRGLQLAMLQHEVELRVARLSAYIFHF